MCLAWAKPLEPVDSFLLCSFSSVFVPWPWSLKRCEVTKTEWEASMDSIQISDSWQLNHHRARNSTWCPKNVRLTSEKFKGVLQRTHWCLTNSRVVLQDLALHLWLRGAACLLFTLFNVEVFFAAKEIGPNPICGSIFLASVFVFGTYFVSRHSATLQAWIHHAWPRPPGKSPDGWNCNLQLWHSTEGYSDFAAGDGIKGKGCACLSMLF